MLFKDSCNRKSNQQNLGTIKSSNLCIEIIEYSSPTETAVCNLASIALPRYVREKDVPTESQPSKLIGSKGSRNRYFDFDKLAEVTSIVTTNLNKIIDVNYYPVESSKRSMFDLDPLELESKVLQIHSFYLACHLIHQSGEFVVVKKHLLNDLPDMGLWSPALKNQIIYDNGSVQNIPEFPFALKFIYKTVWEIKQRILVDMAVDRGCFVDQSQSLNVHMDQPIFGKITSLRFHAWSKGLKTGMYCLRSRVAADAIKFTVNTSMLNEKPKAEADESTKISQMVCSLTN